MTQRADYPTILAELVEELHYRPGWTFRLVDRDRGQGSVGLTFVIRTRGYDSYHVDRGETYSVLHYFPVPPAAYDGRSWRHWILEQLLLVERHEACEFFALDVGYVSDGNQTADVDVERLLMRPYAPSHGPGNDPYIVREIGTVEDQRTSFRGELKD
jgi:hypothetical protein